MKSVIWVWTSLSLSWVSSSRCRLSVPSRLASSTAVLILTRGFVSISASWCNWINLNKVTMMSQVFVAFSVHGAVSFVSAATSNWADIHSGHFEYPWVDVCWTNVLLCLNVACLCEEGSSWELICTFLIVVLHMHFWG